MGRVISASEANRHFSELLRYVSEGESFTVMSCGRPVARVLPFGRDQERRSVQQLLAFVAELPVRQSGEGSRSDLYERPKSSTAISSPISPA